MARKLTDPKIKHIPRQLSHTKKIESDSREFIVFSLRVEHDADPVKLGSYAYDAVEGQFLQFFPVNRTSSAHPEQTF